MRNPSPSRTIGMKRSGLCLNEDDESMVLSNSQILATELNEAPWDESHPETLISLWVPLHLQVSI